MRRQQTVKHVQNKTLPFSPPQVLALSFFLLVMIGTMVLKLPFATKMPVSWLDALFTAMSAATVTGLNVVDTGTTYTYFGQFVILALIQVGGLGIMSFALLIFITLGRKIGVKQTIIFREALNQTSFQTILPLVKSLFWFSMIVECSVAVVLLFRFVPDYGWIKGSYYSIFHSISAFNNAGFSPFPTNLVSYVGDPIVMIAITTAIILGGLGFPVVMDMLEKRKFRKLMIHSKLMIIGTIFLNLFAMITLFFLEYTNPQTLQSLHSLSDKLWAAYFQSVTLRTAGFNTIDIQSVTESSAILMIALMFIGAGSTSTGGGIKLTTFIVILLSVITFIKGKKEPVIFQRSIKESVIYRSLAISAVSMMFIFIAQFILGITEKVSYLRILFEVVSAFGTVGLSMNVTPELSSIGRIIIIFLMYIGKIGPLTLIYSLTKQDDRNKANIHYPEGDIFTG
ncbi:TrkH family potassium uptake protein [Massilibacterium senegalense]|uniref:TrkH family potassium uptake protein n=1 Tax=Massilibacterium senegalense TaxID=1632858 RepID=UPI000784DD12|nr:TrkH family potassium uptake protein [Massilibacterium senegalense]